MGSIIARIWAQFQSQSGRRALAFFALLGGAVMLTAYAVWALWLVRAVAEYAFGLGLAAHGGLAIILSGFVALFVKRSIRVGREGIEVTDQPDAPGDGG